MSTIYGKAAVLAANELKKNPEANPREVWKKSVSKFSKSESSINKGCPRTTFLTLCDLGLIDNNLKGDTIRRSKNVGHTINMVNYIKSKNGLVSSKEEIWDAIQEPESKLNSNEQHSVVFALLESNLLKF